MPSLTPPAVLTQMATCAPFRSFVAIARSRPSICTRSSLTGKDHQRSQAADGRQGIRPAGSGDGPRWRVRLLRPATYELKIGETLADVLRMAGGLAPDANARWLQIERIVPTALSERQRPDAIGPR